MGLLDFLIGLAAALAIIYHSIKIGLLIKKWYPYITEVLWRKIPWRKVPWKKIGLKTVGGLRFFGVITGVGALVTAGMILGSFVIEYVTVFYENLPADLKISEISTEVSLLIWIPVIVGSLVLIGYLLEKMGQGFQNMRLLPKNFR